MEIFVANKYGKFIIDDIDSNYGLAFLSPHPLKGSNEVLLYYKLWYFMASTVVSLTCTLCPIMNKALKSATQQKLHRAM